MLPTFASSTAQSAGGQETGHPFLQSNGIISPHQFSTSESQSVAEHKGFASKCGKPARRTLTSHWHLLASRNGFRAAAGANGDRSAHQLGRAGAGAVGSAAGNATGAAAISTRSRLNRCSTASAAFQRSLYTVDGLPDQPLADSPNVSLHLPDADVTITTGSVPYPGTEHHHQRLERAATAIASVPDGGGGGGGGGVDGVIVQSSGPTPGCFWPQSAQPHLPHPRQQAQLRSQHVPSFARPYSLSNRRRGPVAHETSLDDSYLLGAAPAVGGLRGSALPMPQPCGSRHTRGTHAKGRLGRGGSAQRTSSSQAVQGQAPGERLSKGASSEASVRGGLWGILHELLGRAAAVGGLGFGLASGATPFAAVATAAAANDPYAAQQSVPWSNTAAESVLQIAPSRESSGLGITRQGSPPPPPPPPQPHPNHQGNHHNHHDHRHNHRHQNLGYLPAAPAGGGAAVWPLPAAAPTLWVIGPVAGSRVDAAPPVVTELATKAAIAAGAGAAAAWAAASVLTGTSPPAAEPASTWGTLPAGPRACAAAGGGAGPSSALDWDDARNPMSFNYDPTLDAKLPPCPEGDVAAAPSPPAAGPEVLAARAAAPPAPAPPDRSARAPASREGSKGGPGAAVVGSGIGGANGDPHFVVIEMKEPSDRPSTAARAAAAFASGASASAAAPDAAVAALGLTLGPRGRMKSYFGKWRGVGDTLMPAEKPVDIFWSWLGAFLSIMVVALLHQYLTPHVSLPLMIASFGASAVLLFGVPASKLAQPRNFLGGQLVSAVVGVLVRLIFIHAPELLWLSASLGMSTALAAMQLTRTVHPPGGASALIAASVATIGPWHGFKFVLTVFFGCIAMLAVALVANNLSSRRRYPTYWWGK